jgi:hypothetical protein
MKTSILTFLTACAVLISAVPATAHEAPSEIGGFKLGEDITEYEDIEYANYLREVVINDWHGFRKGIISYGTCAYPGQIVKIRMKYEDSSKKFYEELLAKLKQQYGKPTEWNGDAYGILYVWKWRFTDSENRRVNLILQHNLGDDSENIGNVIKLSLPEREEEERLCFIEFCEINKTSAEKARVQQRLEPNWDYMLPR